MEANLHELGLPDHIVRGNDEGRDVRKAIIAELVQKVKDILQPCTQHEVLSEWCCQSERGGVLLPATYEVLDAVRGDALALLQDSEIGKIVERIEIVPARINVEPRGSVFRTAIVVGVLTTLDDWLDDTIVVALLAEPIDGGEP